MIMDYIYRNSQEEKCVGTIEGLVITPVYDFSIKIKDKTNRPILNADT